MALPTGFGKSLIYQVPAMIFDRPTIVISPLIALMADQERALNRCGIPVVATGVGDLPALLVDGLVGECVSADYNDLAEAIFRVLDQTRNYPSAVETACRQVALSHAWSNVAESISVLVESV